MSKSEHVLMPKLKEQLRNGAMSRREFVRSAALLGVAASSAYAMAGMSAPAMAADNMPFPPADPNAKPGGKLRIGQRVAKMEDPATYSWNEMSNQSRPVIEYLTMLGPDNIVRPMLLESWQPSDDLKTWTFNVRKGVMWHNGEELTADHVAWNILRWTDSATGSSVLGLSTFAALATSTGEKGANGKPVRKPTKGAVEVVDKHTLKLHLANPVLSVAEDCAEYTTLIVHPSFKAPFADKPIGTGPFTVAELKVGERCILKRVHKTTDGKDFKYWGGDIYLDEIHFYNFEEDNVTAAVASGTVDAIYELSVDQIPLAKSIEDAEVLAVDSANTLCCRMQVDHKPFDDIRVRKAIIKGVDNAAVKALVFPDGGEPAYNFHVSPVHPEYFPLPPLQRDVEGAKALLKEAGYESGLDLTIDVGNTDGPWHQAVCEAIRDQLKDIGINLNVNVMPVTKFWEIWDKTPFGATSWDHRPLGTMVLAQAYRTGVPWNETHYSDPEYDKALADAEATIDVEKRKAKMQKLEQMLQDAAVMIEPLWRPVYILTTKKVHGYKPHPSRQMQITKVWMDA
jgi:peptide/nickel transport system substrate-binding protein